ncbi:MAG: hypothetical protein KatS3mg057_2638 [Herpetosiphonaceae bacterium]|nr:MAG: hypothetical protein KatS3mg057_2638 [Herpetosiphonaceae bacterium]
MYMCDWRTADLIARNQGAWYSNARSRCAGIGRLFSAKWGLMVRLLLVVATSLLIVLGELLMKQGMQRVGTLRLDVGQLVQAISEWRVSLGLLLVLSGLLTWLGVISRWQLSYAYPLLSFNYILVVLLSWWFLGETLTMGKVVGTIIIMIGIMIVMRGGQA